MNNELQSKLDSTGSLGELNGVYTLPEPYDDSGYYMVYYCEADYRFALPDIVDYIEAGMRVYYDRHLESGEAHIQDFCRRAIGSHCRCVVFYLSENVFSDPAFHALMRLVGERNIPSISVNISSSDKIAAGTDMAVGRELDDDVRSYVDTVFAREVTFIPHALPTDEKIRELRRAYDSLTMHFSIVDDFAVAEYVKDISEYEVIIPPSIEVNGVEYPVKAVSARAFSGCRDLIRIVFPDTVEDIGYGCDDESLGEVFENCESLTELIYPPKVKKLYGGMFNGCTNLRKLILNDGLIFVGDKDNHFSFEAERGTDLQGTSIEDDSDDETVPVNPHSFDKLHLPLCAVKFFEGDGCVRFSYDSSDNCFASLLEVKELTGGSVISLKKKQEITTVTELYMLAFNTEIEEISFPREFYFGQKWIRVFNGCTNLKRVTLPNTVIELDHTFYECSSLEEIILPDSIAAIHTGSFYSCKALRTVYLPSHVCSVSDSAFLGCHIGSLICDSKYAYNIFKKGYRTPSIVYAQQNRFLRFVVGLAMRLFGTTKDQKVTKGIQWWTEIDRIYIKDDVKEFDVEGYEKVKSDKPGYRRYDCRISFGARLRFKGDQFKLRNKK